MIIYIGLLSYFLKYGLLFFLWYSKSPGGRQTVFKNKLKFIITLIAKMRTLKDYKSNSLTINKILYICKSENKNAGIKL